MNGQVALSFVTAMDIGTDERPAETDRRPADGAQPLTKRRDAAGEDADNRERQGGVGEEICGHPSYIVKRPYHHTASREGEPEAFLSFTCPCPIALRIRHGAKRRKSKGKGCKSSQIETKR